MNLHRRFLWNHSLMLACSVLLAGCATNLGTGDSSARLPSLAPSFLRSEQPGPRGLPDMAEPPGWSSTEEHESDTGIQLAGYEVSDDEVSDDEPIILPVAAKVSTSYYNPTLTEADAASIPEITRPLVIGSEDYGPIEGEYAQDDGLYYDSGEMGEYETDCDGEGCRVRKRPLKSLGRKVLHSEKKQVKRDGARMAKSMGIVPPKEQRKLRRDIGSHNPHFPRELRMASHPLYVVEPPDVLYIETLQLLEGRPIAGERLVRQDGTIDLGYYGQIHVAGLTLEEVEAKLRERLVQYVKEPLVYVDVAAFNSKVYYVMGQVQQTGRLPITGKETVLDAITLAGGLTNFAKVKDIHVARPNPGGGCDQILFVDYKALVDCGDTRTNYQLFPGDRVVVPATIGYKVSVYFDNFLTPFERVANLFALVRFSTDSN